MNGQIVLCRGYNDGEELVRTLRDLLEYAPLMQSVSVVPVGLTDYREGLCPLEPIGQGRTRGRRSASSRRSRKKRTKNTGSILPTPATSSI